MTAVDIMSVFARWQRFHELDEADKAKRLLEQSCQQNKVAINPRRRASELMSFA
jgi:hypothetical protein